MHTRIRIPTIHTGSILRNKARAVHRPARAWFNKNLCVGIIQLQTVTGVKIPISVLIVPKIAPPLQNLLHTSLQNILHLKGLQLAHPVADNENFEISVQNGADYY